MEPTTHKEFICVHGDALTRAEAMRTEFQAAATEVAGRHIDYMQLTTFVVYNLQNYGVTITGIPSDMWSAVLSEQTAFVEAPEDADDNFEEFQVVHRVRLECDLIEDGLMATWLHYYKRSKDAG